MFSRHRHRALVDGMIGSQRPVAESGSYSLYWLNEPGGPDPDLAPELVVVHDLRPPDIDNNIGRHVRQALIPMLQEVWRTCGADIPVWGVAGQQPHALFTQLFGMTLYSAHADPRTCSRWFYRNTLRALREEPDAIDPQDSIQPFGAIYRRILALHSGGSLLDAGTCHGFLPLLMGAELPATDRVLGVDIEEFLIAAARRQADEGGLTGVEFLAADLFGPQVASLPRFETVTAIHLLEHLSPVDTERALEVLWEHTGERLIVNVPIEQTPDPYFGHEQTFTVDTLATLGKRLDGRVTTFEEHGAWLVIERA